MTQNSALWIIDVQEKLFSKCDRYEEVLQKMALAIRAATLLKLPLFVTEQYPRGLGNTVPELTIFLPENQSVHSKTTFSGYFDPEIKLKADALGAQRWILIGIEAHICVLQTAKDLLASGKEVVVLNDAITSRSLYDFGTAVGEMRDHGAHISSTEACFYELLRDSKHPQFSQFLDLIKGFHA